MKMDTVVLIACYFVAVFAILEYFECLDFAHCTLNVLAFALGWMIRDYIMNRKKENE